MARKSRISVIFLWALAALCLHANVALAVTSDITSSFSISMSGLTLNRTTNTFDMLVSLTNRTSARILGPVSLVVTGLPSGVTLVNATGTASDGNPYLAVAVGNLGIDPNGHVTGLLLKFGDPTRKPISFSARVLGDATTFGDPAQWPTYTDTVAGIQFRFPNFGQNAYAVPSQEDNVAVVDIRFRHADGSSELGYEVFFNPNTSSSSLNEWFSRYVDVDGTMLSSGAFASRQYLNGVQAYVLVGPLSSTAVDIGGPVSDIYAISPSHQTIIVITKTFDSIESPPSHDVWISVMETLLAGLTVP